MKNTTNLRSLTIGLLSGLVVAGLVLTLRMLKDEDPADIYFFGTVLLAIVFLPWMFPSVPNFKSASLLVILAIFQQALAVFLFAAAIRKVQAVEATLITALNPLGAALWVFLVLGELPGFWALCGAVITFTAVFGNSLISALAKEKASKTFAPAID